MSHAIGNSLLFSYTYCEADQNAVGRKWISKAKEGKKEQLRVETDREAAWTGH
jgi:hypothetical protein